MAIYHYSVKSVSRGKGSSVVNSAAYRSAEELYDNRQEQFFHYEGKERDIMYKEILLPENAPTWMQNREVLWNAVEASEKRKDSQLARELEIALPREFTTDQNIALIKEYVQKEFVDRGMIADICLHYGKRGEEYNPHAHVLLTMRSVDENGFGKKNTEWNKRSLLKEWRESWANCLNRHLSLNGYDIRVDHRSLKDQGIDLKPQNVELPNDAKERLNDQQARQVNIMRENGERLLANPEIGLLAITRTQSTFTELDMARYLNTRTADAEQFHMVFERMKAHESLVVLAIEDGRAVYTTKEVLNLEKQLFSDARFKSLESNFSVEKIVVKDELSVEQKAAVEYLCQNKDLRCVVGYAGTGKTYMLQAAKEIWEDNGYRVTGVALSGIAAQGMEKGAGLKSTTVARRLLDWENNRERLSNKDILVIDEAGMLGTRDISKLVSEAKEANAKIVMLGDPQQLQAIEAGAAFRGIVEREGCLKMGDVRRQEIDWQREATKMLAIGKVDEALQAYSKEKLILSRNDRPSAIESMVSIWSSNLKLDETQIMLAHRKSDVKDLNKQARGVLKRLGVLVEGVTVDTVNGHREFSKNDQIYFLKNDNGLGVKNGTLAKVVSIDRNGEMSVNVKDRTFSFNCKDYNHLDHGYAATVHKAQGVTVDRSYVLVSKGFNQHLTYVAMSRHTKEATIFWSQDEFKNFPQLTWHLSRDGKKENALDYEKKDFAVYRGMGIDSNATKVSEPKIVKESLSRVERGHEHVMNNLEHRRLMNEEVKRLESRYSRSIEKEVGIGEILKYFSNTKIGKQDYAVMEHQNGTLKLIPAANCNDLEVGSEARIYQSREGKIMAAPTGNELWNRRVRDISKEFGKEVSFKISSGEEGRYRGIVICGTNQYAVMEQYDKVKLVDRSICYKGIKADDYIKIEKSKTNELKMVHDIKTQREMDNSREMSRGMSLSL